MVRNTTGSTVTVVVAEDGRPGGDLWGQGRGGGRPSGETGGGGVGGLLTGTAVVSCLVAPCRTGGLVRSGEQLLGVNPPGVGGLGAG